VRPRKLARFLLDSTAGFAKILTRNRICILNYHRILRPGQRMEDVQFDSGTYSGSEVDFNRHLDVIQDYGRVLTADEFLDVIDGKIRSPKNSVFLTFDDGYEDNYSVAYRLLRERKLTATFFVPTERLMNRTLEWWDLIAYFVKKTPKDKLVLRRVEAEIDIGVDRKKAISRLLTMVKNKRASTAAVVEDLAEEAGVEYPNAQDQDREILSPAQVKEMLEGGMGIGAHGHSHRILSHLSVDDQRQEITTSKKILENVLGDRVTMLSYPVGGAGHYSEATKQIVKEAGFRCAFNFQAKRWLVDPKNLDRYDINRVGVLSPSDRRLRALLGGLP